MSALRFCDLYREHARFVLNVIRRRGVPEPAVDDVAQEVFLVVHRRFNEFRGVAALRAWLARIAENCVRNYRRAGRRHAKNEALCAWSVEGHELVDPSDDPLAQVCRREVREAVREAVASLGPAKASIFVLSELQQLTPAQIASETATTLNTVYTRRRAARSLFRKAIRRRALLEGWEAATEPQRKRSPATVRQHS